MSGNIKNSIGLKVFSFINILFMSIFALLCIYPFYYVFIMSISSPGAVLSNVYLLPQGFSLDVYIGIFLRKQIGNAFLVSIARTLTGTMLTVFCCSLFAYILTKKFFLRPVIYKLLIFTMYFNAGLIPYYITIKNYKLTDSFIVYIIPMALSAFYVVLLKTFMEQIPPSLEESAQIDGAGLFTTYIKIILPVSKPIIATIAVFAAVGQWNSWMDNYLFVHNARFQTLQLVLYRYLTEAESFAREAQTGNYSSKGIQLTALSLRMGITMVTSLPILFVYPFLQKYFVKGIMLGAIKG